MRTIYPGIRRISYVDANLLPPNLELKASTGVPGEVLTDMEEAEIISAKLTVESSDNKWPNLDTATLEIFTSEKIRFPVRSGFVIDFVNGERAILGKAEAPYAKIGSVYTSGDKQEPKAGYTYTVTYTGYHALVPVSN